MDKIIIVYEKLGKITCYLTILCGYTLIHINNDLSVKDKIKNYNMCVDFINQNPCTQFKIF